MPSIEWVDSNGFARRIDSADHVTIGRWFAEWAFSEQFITTSNMSTTYIRTYPLPNEPQRSSNAIVVSREALSAIMELLEIPYDAPAGDASADDSADHTTPPSDYVRPRRTRPSH
jgi:hypothetical protein